MMDVMLSGDAAVVIYSKPVLPYADILARITRRQFYIQKVPTRCWYSDTAQPQLLIQADRALAGSAVLDLQVRPLDEVTST